jgi:hypothetical protein
MALEGLGHVSRSGSSEGSQLACRDRSASAPGRRLAASASIARNRHQHLIGLAGAIPFQHGEFGMVQRPALAVAIDMGES